MIGFLLVLLMSGSPREVVFVRTPQECIFRANLAVNGQDYDAAHCIPLVKDRDA